MEISFTTVGGRQRATVDIPDGATATVLVAPALGMRATYYRTLCRQLQARGVATLAVDLPGQGASPVRANRGTDWGYREVVEHYASALRAVHAVEPARPTFVLGHSIGGQVGLMASGLDIPGLAGVVVVASGCPYWKTWDGLEAYRVRAATWTCGAVARVLGVFPGDKLGFGGREPQTLMRQWVHAAQSGRYVWPGFDGDALLARPGPPVLGVRIEGDSWAPTRSVQLTLDRMAGREVTFERWYGAPHGGDHNRWPSEPTYIADRMAAFALASRTDAVPAHQ